jgi:hypothetical protein
MVVAKRGYEGARWYPYHESAIDPEFMVVDFNRTADILEDMYSTPLKPLRAARMKHLELQSRTSAGREWIVAQPVDSRDEPLTRKGERLGKLTLFLFAVEKPWYLPPKTTKLTTARAALETTTDKKGQDWVRFIFAKDWYDDYAAHEAAYRDLWQNRQFTGWKRRK